MERLKVLLGISDTSQDELLRLILEETEDFVKSYCKCKTVPSKLESLIPVIAADVYRHKGYGKSDAPQRVKSISQGERSVSYENEPRTNDVFAAYYKRLNPYRRAMVPSEVSENESV